MAPFIRDLRDVLVRPRALCGRSLTRPQPVHGVSAALLLGLAYATLYGWLAADGHQPSMTRGLPMAAESYYRAAALFALPLVLALTALVVLTVHILGNRSAKTIAPTRVAVHVFGLTYAAPLLVAYLIPDLVAYGIFGFDALGTLIRYSGMVAVIWVAVLTFGNIRAVYGVRPVRAALTTLAAALLQGIPAALLLR